MFNERNTLTDRWFRTIVVVFKPLSGNCIESHIDDEATAIEVIAAAQVTKLHRRHIYVIK